LIKESAGPILLGVESLGTPLSPVCRVRLIFINHDFLSIQKKSVISFNVLMDVEIHSVMHFLWLRGASNEQIMSQIKETYGEA
jgi:hypothetical protein